MTTTETRTPALDRWQWRKTLIATAPLPIDEAEIAAAGWADAMSRNRGLTASSYADTLKAAGWLQAPGAPKPQPAPPVNSSPGHAELNAPISGSEPPANAGGERVSSKSYSAAAAEIATGLDAVSARIDDVESQAMRLGLDVIATTSASPTGCGAASPAIVAGDGVLDGGAGGSSIASDGSAPVFSPPPPSASARPSRATVIAVPPGAEGGDLEALTPHEALANDLMEYIDSAEVARKIDTRRLVDPTTGRLDEGAARWLAQTLADAEQQAARIATQAEKAIAAIRSRQRSLAFRFGPHLADFVRAHLPKKAKTWNGPEFGGDFRAAGSKGGLKLLNAAAAAAWAQSDGRDPAEFGEYAYSLQWARLKAHLAALMEHCEGETSDARIAEMRATLKAAGLEGIVAFEAPAPTENFKVTVGEVTIDISALRQGAVPEAPKQIEGSETA